MKATDMTRNEIIGRLYGEGIDVDDDLPRTQLNSIWASREDWVSEDEAQENWEENIEYTLNEKSIVVHSINHEDVLKAHFGRSNVIPNDDIEHLLERIERQISAKRHEDQFGFFEIMVELRELLKEAQ